jgi:hypothetical protein
VLRRELAARRLRRGPKYLSCFAVIFRLRRAIFRPPW